MQKAEIQSISIEAFINWKCPHCGTEQLSKVNVNPYRIPTEDLPDEQCNDCGEYVTLASE